MYLVRVLTFGAVTSNSSTWDQKWFRTESMAQKCTWLLPFWCPFTSPTEQSGSLEQVCSMFNSNFMFTHRFTGHTTDDRPDLDAVIPTEKDKNNPMLEMMKIRVGLPSSKNKSSNLNARGLKYAQVCKSVIVLLLVPSIKQKCIFHIVDTIAFDFYNSWISLIKAFLFRCHTAHWFSKRFSRKVYRSLESNNAVIVSIESLLKTLVDYMGNFWVNELYLIFIIQREFVDIRVILELFLIFSQSLCTNSSSNSFPSN